VPGVSKLLADLVKLSFGEKVVSRVSGVPLKESPAPLDERGDEGWKPTATLWSVFIADRLASTPRPKQCT
jgi:hypothetical protein